MMDNNADKLYYTIGEVADMFAVNTSLIRYWEKEFDVLKPKKNRKGNRLFTRRDLQYLHLIYHLVKEKGYTLQGAKDALKEDGESLADKIRIREVLLNTRMLLSEINQSMSERLKEL
jgi:DNA-binding transcriptional MerR regulator